MRSMTGKEEIFKSQVYVFDTDVAFLCGKKTLEQWGSKLDTVKGVLETEMNRDIKRFKMIDISMGHYGIRLEVQKKESGEIMYLEEKMDELSEFRAIKKVHEANNHWSAEQLIDAYSKEGWMSPKDFRTN